jgi:Protein of unknown function (DUF3800)
MKVSDILKRLADARDAPVGLHPSRYISFYCDESSQNAHRFVVLGVMVIMSESITNFRADLAAVRRNYENLKGEMAWTKINSYKTGAYWEWLEIFEAYAKTGAVRMTALTLDTHQPANRGWGREADLGFNKLLYQLLLHRVGKRHASANRSLHGFLDSRTTRHLPEDLRRMLNGGLRNMSMTSNPFRSIVFRDSKTSDLIQLVDVLIGGLAFRLNEHDIAFDARPDKIRLSIEIHNVQKRLKGQFDIWPFRYNR